MGTTPNHQLPSHHSRLIKTKDAQGNEVHGVYRSPTGGLVVKNDAAYQKYLREKEQAEKINRLEEDITEIKNLLKQLVQSKG